ncbi:ionotropic receptor 75a-like [Chelonus insularis]|uniref:ionotropic receptor 75a-like n=1 Tax=Chelonus insularis TaxID=460826 RepID=UPI00158C4794|nr:ionotropic receptor 75a-like [Chelonus insularis]
MNLKIWLILSTLLFQLIQCDKDLIHFLREYFASNYIHQLVIFACWNAIELVKKITQLDTVVSYNLIHEHIDIISLLKVNYYHIGVILDYDCPKSNFILKQFSDQLVFNDSYFWLLLTEASSPPTASLRDLPLTVQTEMTVATRKNELFELYDVYNPSYRHGGFINITYKGQWTPKNGLVNKLTQYKYIRRQNLSDLSLNASIVLTKSTDMDFEKYVTEPVNPQLDTMARFQHAVNLILRDYYNFRLNLKRSSSWGMLVNGSWNGIIGEMLDGVTDLSSSPFYFRPERLSVCEYTVSLWNVNIGFIFRHPRKDEMKNSFLKPFTTLTWSVSLVIGITYCICLFITVKVEACFNKFEISENTLMSIPASESGLITMAAISQQGVSNSPSTFSGRIVFLSLFLWAFLLYQYYSADIVSSLLAKPPRWIISVKDLLDSNLECGMEDILYSYYFHKLTTDPFARQLYLKKVTPNKNRLKGEFYLAEEGYKRVRKGGFAFYCDFAIGYKIIEETFNDDEICELQEILVIKPHVKTWSVVSKNSPFKKMFTYGYRKIVEHGISKRLYPIWHHRKPICPEAHNSKPSPMNFNDFCPALFFLLIGVGVSIIILAVECLHNKFFESINLKNMLIETKSPSFNGEKHQEVIEDLQDF